jgi:nucleotide-binding universal stress UspA family protein
MISILVPTDFSENAYHALKYAANMNLNQPIHIILLHTYDVLPSANEMFISIDDILLENSRKGLLNEVEQLKLEFDKAIFTYDLKSFCGNLKYGIKNTIKKYDVDLVLMGTNGAKGLQKLLIGSNASGIISNIGKPLIIIPDNELVKPFKSIVLALDYNDEIQVSIFKGLKLISDFYHSKVIALTVIPIGATDEVLNNQKYLKMKEKLESIVDSYELVEGRDIIEEISNYISQNNVDMLAVIPHKLDSLQKFFHTSISKEIAMRAEIPMMAIH